MVKTLKFVNVIIFFLSLFLSAHNFFLVAQNIDAIIKCETVADCPPDTEHKKYRCVKNICIYRWFL
ncbi:Nodule Cysteine-Rich (NCR) secreted peptide [Medicago truncatula]|uniref:Nodule Cysteine-Rich (NCR) secreted peptide n=1 Tax=Medicago truncatula TaxID=3880 RepID=A0A072VDG0_MEDTR|nr:Nodule Cysteine-Rich (NCR) secreted peptide [Medicago truncatula]